VADLLVRLYDLPPLEPAVAAPARHGLDIRRAMAHERAAVVAFAAANGSTGWASECEVAFARQPLACFVATERAGESDRLVGFACYEAACRNFFGPELVSPDHRGRGVGRGLALAALHAMRAEGYAYAIIGWAASPEFYRRAFGAIVIEGSEPGIYPRRSDGGAP
jgi:ribosomal protein S18 acetylase RimI-like enzyme